MLSAKGGRHWKEDEYALQNAIDTYCGEVRTNAELKRGLERLHEIKDVPLKAENPHELGRCLETLFLVTNPEMVMRASLAREESRKLPTKSSRADFPEQDYRNCW
jgi:succinate dehydrogenase/fumarate reductase flavoprotein subunit